MAIDVESAKLANALEERLDRGFVVDDANQWGFRTQDARRHHMAIVNQHLFSPASDSGALTPLVSTFSAIALNDNARDIGETTSM
ncbi:MAG: hypothetical protein ACJAYX_002120 [Planctomycetota bacterium]|jgi:hypothetical protein